MGRGIIVRLRYVHQYTDEHGQLRRYYRRPGYPRVRLRGALGSAEFLAAYQQAQAGIPLPPRQIGAGRDRPGSVSVAVAAYYQHAHYLTLAPSTRRMRRAILERLRTKHGDKSLDTLTRRQLADMLGKMRPFAARNWLKTLRGLFGFAAAVGLRDDNPTIGVRLAKAKPGGFHTWSENEIAQYEAYHAPGTRARLAMALLLYTAARRGDIVRLGPQNVRAGSLYYRQQKTGRRLAIPIPALVPLLATAQPGHLTYLVTAAGAPFTVNGFGNWFRKCCDAAGLPHCSAHGLCKAQSRRLAEAGCTAPQIAAITGHRSLSEVQRYIAAAEQATLAQAAIATVSRTRIGSRPHPRAKAAKTA